MTATRCDMSGDLEHAAQLADGRPLLLGAFSLADVHAYMNIWYARSGLTHEEFTAAGLDRILAAFPAVLAFVTSLPHPANCASYEARSALLVDTLHSVLRQRDPRIHVVVVANEDPACTLPDDPRLEVVRVPYPPSASPPGKPSLVGIEIDKGAKLGIGTSRATAVGAEHVMWVDSDDFVHRDIAGTVAEAPDVPGWYFDSGYYHIRGERKVTTVLHGFHQRNGSSHVLRTDVIDVFQVHALKAADPAS